MQMNLPDDGCQRKFTLLYHSFGPKKSAAAQFFCTKIGKKEEAGERAGPQYLPKTGREYRALCQLTKTDPGGTIF